MNFDKESKSEEKKNFFFGGGGGGGGGNGEKVGFRPKKKCIHLLFVLLMLHIKFSVPSSSGSLVLTQNKTSNGQIRGITLPTFTEFCQKSS